MKFDGDFDNVRTDVSFTTVDTHTAGEPTRILLDGLDRSTLTGDSVRAKRESFAEQYDPVRELLLREPRGHDDMFGAVVVEPHDDETDIGVFFMDSDGYLDMCGHGTIGVVSALVELGHLSAEPTIYVETPAGGRRRSEAPVRRRGGSAGQNALSPKPPSTVSTSPVT